MMCKGLALQPSFTATRLKRRRTKAWRSISGSTEKMIGFTLPRDFPMDSLTLKLGQRTSTPSETPADSV